MSWDWLNIPSWDLVRLTRSVAKRSLSASFLSKESVTQRDIIDGWKLGEFNSSMHRATSFSSRALKHHTKKPIIKNDRAYRKLQLINSLNKRVNDRRHTYMRLYNALLQIFPHIYAIYIYIYIIAESKIIHLIIWQGKYKQFMSLWDYSFN